MLPGPITTQAVMSPGPMRLYHAVGELLVESADSLSFGALYGVSFEDSSVMVVPEAERLRWGDAQCVEIGLCVQTLNAESSLLPDEVAARHAFDFQWSGRHDNIRVDR